MENLHDEIYQEKYFGKQDSLLRCEEYIKEIMDEVNKNPNNLIDCNKLQANKKLENELCNIFGFRKTYIVWKALNIPNAYTITNSHVHFSNIARAITIDKKKGYYDPTHQDVLFVCVYNGLITRNNLTPSELLAVILHEIGHNFDYSIYNTIQYVLHWFAYTVMDHELNQNLKTLIANEELKHNEVLVKNSDRMKDFENYLKANEKLRVYSKATKSPFLWVKDALLSPIKMIVTPINQIRGIFDKRKEHFADSFASAYGYSTELAIALEKLGNYPESLIKADNFTKLLYDLGEANYEMARALTEIHGTEQERVKMLIKKLENDLNTGDYPQDCKNDIMKEIEELKKIYEKSLSMNPEVMNKYSVAIRKFFDKVFDGIPNIQKLFPKNQV